MMRTSYIFSITVIFLLITSQLQAQDFYLLGGINVSKLGQTKHDEFGNLSRELRPGFHVGGAVDITIKGNFSFMPNLLFSLKREYIETIVYFAPMEEFEDFGFIQTKATINDFYLDMPLNLKYRFSLGNVDLHALAGPFINVQLFDRSNSEFNTNVSGFETGEPFKEKFMNRIDYGITAGVGVDFNVVSTQLTYDHGFYRKMKYEEIVYDNPVRNSVLKLTIGYKL